MPSTKEVAEQLVAHCRNHTEAEGLRTLYAPDAVSVEAADMGGTGRETKGVEAIQGKHDWWFSSHEVHDSAVEGPFMHGDDRFGVIFEMEVSRKDTGERMPRMKELGIYHVANGHIVREEFFYAM